MTRSFSIAAFVLGALAVLWMAATFIGSNFLAVAITAVIAVVYIAGFNELIRYQKATVSLSEALAGISGEVNCLESWVKKIDVSLQEAVQLRLEGERVGLPTPVLTPYLVGLLVMLGLLGTFAGMVDTLSGAVTALQGTSELQAIREGLAAPIEGLSLAFGTSVAGVATSAMLGLISTLSRRERLITCKELDRKSLTVFRSYSLSYNRKETFKAMQAQAEALPEVAKQLTMLADNVSTMASSMGEQLLTNQQAFLTAAEQQYQQLAESVDKTLQSSLKDSARLLGEGVEPIFKEAVGNIHNEVTSSVKQLHEDLGRNSEAQIGLLQQQFGQASESLIAAFNGASNDWLDSAKSSEEQRFNQWGKSLESAQHQSAELHKQMTITLADASNIMIDSAKENSISLVGNIASVMEKTESLVEKRLETESHWLAHFDSRVEALTATLKSELGEIVSLENKRSENVVGQIAVLEEAVAKHLADLGNALEAPMTRLIETACEAPQAAAELIEKLRTEMVKNIERDNQLIAERERSMEALAELSGSLQQASVEQSKNIDTLVASTAELFQNITQQFHQKVEGETDKLGGVAEQFAASAIELSCLGEAFEAAINAYSTSNNEFIEKLSVVESALNENTARSDEQLGYYVTQARELIDHSIVSQKEIFDALRQLSSAVPVESDQEEELA